MSVWGLCLQINDCLVTALSQTYFTVAIILAVLAHTQLEATGLADRLGGRRSPAVACCASDHWVASSNPLRGKFRH